MYLDQDSSRHVDQSMRTLFKSICSDVPFSIPFCFGFLHNKSFQIHKQIGTYGKFLIPLHVAGGLQHAARGQAIFARINPFRKPRA
jgi:hypothetical protein